MAAAGPSGSVPPDAARTPSSRPQPRSESRSRTANHAVPAGTGAALCLSPWPLASLLPEREPHAQTCWRHALAHGAAAVSAQSFGADFSTQEERETQHEKARLHTDRTARGDRHHCHIGGDPVSGVCEGPREGAAVELPEQPQATGPRQPDVRAGLRRDVAAVAWVLGLRPGPHSQRSVLVPVHHPLHQEPADLPVPQRGRQGARPGLLPGQHIPVHVRREQRLASAGAGFVCVAVGDGHAVRDAELELLPVPAGAQL